jgi:2-polyprenyl-6-hydroxyphenyl methylase / 3-demethylubiquinone-9 3-methyltransferase
MPVNNDLYNRPEDIWWDEREPLSMLHTLLNPARFGYFRDVLTQLRRDPRGMAALDVGCGGGLLAEEFARLGCVVTGVDPSEASLATARAHAQQSGLRIDYRPGAGEDLPFPAAAFELVYCCDVLEHVRDRERVVAEISRVLRPGGIFFFDTINRTLLSRFILITLAQKWRPTRLVPPDLHDWRLFITPAELQGVLRRHALAPGGMVGLQPRIRPLAALRDLWLCKRGTITSGELGRRLALRAGPHLSLSYAGYALKAG